MSRAVAPLANLPLPLRRRWPSGVIAGVVTLAMAAGMVWGFPADAVASPPAARADRSVPVSALDIKAAPLEPMTLHTVTPPVWPTAGQAVIDIAPSAARSAVVPVVVGGLPVIVSSVDAVETSGLMSTTFPARVRVEVLDRQMSLRGGAPLALRISRADGGSGPAKVRLQVDTSGFRQAFGGVYGARLEMQLVAECGLTAIAQDQAIRGACAPLPLDSVTDFKTGIVSADIDLNTALKGLVDKPLSVKEQAIIGMESDSASQASPDGMVVMMTSSSSAQGVGTFGKTDLKEASTWSVGGNAGNFSYSYPLAVPPVPGLSPQLSLDYSSATVDGQTAAEHVQNGQFGEGWGLSGGGFIESTFRPCALDSDHSPRWASTTGDPCWRHENYQLSWGGRSGELVPTGVSNVWKLADDDGSRVEYVNSGGAGWHWRITTDDGTQYYFGRQRLPGWSPGGRETGSVLSQEVFSNHDGEPCTSTQGLQYAHCRMPYRWHLDYVVDVHGNSMSYWYSRWDNLSGSLGSGQTVYAYDRDAILGRIEYGTRVGNEAVAIPPAKIEFTPVDRCLTDCGTEAAPVTANWYDTPFDKRCTAAPCNNNLTPSYWTTKRVNRIYTSVWKGTGVDYGLVDEWTLGQSFPGGTDVPTLWLDSVTRKGFDADGTSITMPALTTHGRKDRNRADYDPGANMADPQKYRIDYIDTEAGARIAVSYLPTNQAGDACTWWSGKSQAQWPNYNHNASRCFQQWVTNRSGQSAWSWWHKFVVDKVTETDLVGGSPPVETSYEYTMDGATSNHPLVLWGYTSSVWASPKKAMSAWHGYPTVITTVGPAGGTRSKTKRLYYRGLDRDTGLDPAQEFFRQSAVLDSTGTSVVDHLALAGRLREEIVYDGATGPELTKTITTESVIATSAGGTLPSWQTPPERYAYLAGQTSVKTIAKLADGSWRTTQADRSVDPVYGTVTQVNDLGQTSPAMSNDDTCTRNWFSRNVTPNLMVRKGTGAGAFNQPTAGTVFSADWSAYDIVFSPGDFTGDGKPDVIARNPSDFNLYLWTGNGAGGFASGPTLIGTGGWTPGNINQIFSPGDFTGDGKSDLIARQSDGNLYLFPGNGNGTLNQAGWSIIGTGGWYSNVDRIFSVGDFNGDGKSDILARQIDDKLYLYPGNGNGTLNQAGWSLVGPGWNSFDQIFGRGDLDGDGKPDILARNPVSTELRLFKGTGLGTVTPGSTLVSSGWLNQGAMLAGEFTGDGIADLLTRDLSGWITGAVNRTERVGVNCAATVTYPGDLISDSRTFHDSNTVYGAIPVKGLVTRTEQAKSHNGTVASYMSTGEAGFDQYGRPTWTKDPLGRQSTNTYTHNSAGRLATTTTTTPPPTVGGIALSTTTAYDAHRGMPTTVTDANGRVSTGKHDQLGRMTTAWLHGHATNTTPDLQYTYSVSKTAAPYIVGKRLGPNGNQLTTVELYDGRFRARQVQTTAPDGKRIISDSQYDSRGLLAKSSTFYNASVPGTTLASYADIDVERQMRYAYDGAGRQTSTQPWSTDQPLGSQFNTTYTYAGADSLGVTPPQGGIPTTAISNAQGQVTQLRQHSGGTIAGPYLATSYGFNRAGELATITDPVGNQWTYSYNLLGQLVVRTDPDAGRTDFTYNALGLMETTKNSLNQTLYFGYDQLGRVIETRDNDASGTLRSSWTYDSVAKGLLTSSTRWVGTNAFKSEVRSYNDRYQPTWTQVTIPASEIGLAGVYESRMTYKSDGQIATSWSPALGLLPQETLTYSYNDAGLPTSVIGLDAYLAAITYNWDGRPAQVQQGSGNKRVQATFGYEAPSGRLLTHSVSTESQAVPNTWTERAGSVYGYDPAGQIKSVAGSTNGVADQKECFNYDYLQRLTDAWTIANGTCTTPTRTGADPYQRTWSFDNLGNRTQQIDRDPTGDTTWNYTNPVGVSPQPHTLTSITANGPKAGVANRSFTYDAAGNTKTRTTATGATQNLTWDPEGNLAAITGGGTSSSYVYTTSGSRLIARDGTIKTLYLGAAELRYDSTDGSTKATRFYGGAVRNPDTGLYWTTSNQQGTNQTAINATDLSVSARRTMPYGETRGTAPASWPDKKGFVGGSQDPSGLLHIGSREYDPSIGRFQSVDPLIHHGSSQQVHGYSYAHNNPTTYSDPGGQADRGPNGGSSHEIATELRVQRIIQQYGAKNVYYPDVNGNGPDIICWDCGPDILIWEVKPVTHGTTFNFNKEIAYITGGGNMLGDRIVRPGDNLGPAQAGYNSRGLIVVVGSSPQEGLELYETEEEDKSNRKRADDAIAGTAEARETIRANRLENGRPTAPLGDSRGRNQEARMDSIDRQGAGRFAGKYSIADNDVVYATEPWEDPVFILIVSIVPGGRAVIGLAKLAAPSSTVTRVVSRAPGIRTGQRYTGPTSVCARACRELGDRAGV